MSNKTPTPDLTIHQESFQRARMSRDARFDGKFFIGVVTTGIFCRPICRVKPPKEENVRYYATAVIAQQQGFRPCKRCLPELAPEPRLALTEKQLLNALLIHQGNVNLSAEHCQLSERQYRRRFSLSFGVTPNQYWQQHRLLSALKLLRNSNLSITDVCFASGFNSVRRFNEAIKVLYGKAPSLLAEHITKEATNQAQIKLPYQGEFDWPLMLSFFALRQIKEIEHVTEQQYARVFILDSTSGYFTVRHSEVANEKAILLTVHTDNFQILPTLISRVRKMFDLDANLEIIHQTIGGNENIRKVIERTPGLRLPGCFDLFEFTIRAILGQQVSVKAATTLAKRICVAYGLPCKANPLGMSHHFPDNSRLLTANFEDLGLTQSRISTLKLWCQYYENNHQIFNYYNHIEEVQQELVKLKGIGPWTVNYIAMRGLSDPDAFPSADLGIIKALSEKGCAPKERIKNKDILALAQQWRPWRAYAAIYLWQSLSINE